MYTQPHILLYKDSVLQYAFDMTNLWAMNLLLHAKRDLRVTTCNCSEVSIKCFSDRNKSELFANANAVAFAGFHRQPSLGLLQGLLYLEVCKSRSASGI